MLGWRRDGRMVDTPESVKADHRAAPFTARRAGAATHAAVSRRRRCSVTLVWPLVAQWTSEADHVRRRRPRCVSWEQWIDRGKGVCTHSMSQLSWMFPLWGWSAHTVWTVELLIVHLCFSNNGLPRYCSYGTTTQSVSLVCVGCWTRAQE